MSSDNSQRVSETIGALLPPEGAAESAYPPAFRAIAELLLGRTTLFIAGKPHRLSEIEFYWFGPGHEDPFAHKDADQKQLGRWYFHRQDGGQYKGGTYKGLDIAIGSETTFGGILIRGAKALEGTRAILDGPCMFVDHILSLNSAPSISSLVSTFNGTIDPPDSSPGSSPLYLALNDDEREAPRVYLTPRVGLTLKKGPTEERQRFVARLYRFLTDPKDIKKGRAHIVLGLHREGVDAAEIAKLTGVSASNVSKYVSAYKDGAFRSPAELAGDLSADEICALFGACDHRFP